MTQQYLIDHADREFYDVDGGPKSNTLGYYLAKPGAMRLEKMFESVASRDLTGIILDNAIPTPATVGTATATGVAHTKNGVAAIVVGSIFAWRGLL